MSVVSNRVVAAILSVFLAVVAANVHAGPSPRRSEQSIRAALLRETPLGSSMRDVVAMVERHQWSDMRVDETRGFYDRRAKSPTVTGEKSIEALLGEYKGIFSITTVTLYWAFDAQDLLLDLCVWKETDGP